MYFQVFEPPELLRHLVHSIQVMEFDKDDEINRLEKQKIVPYGFCGLFFHYKNTCYQTDNIAGKRLLPYSFFAGLTNQPIEINFIGDTGTIAVNFYPTGLYHFLKSPIDELTNATVDSTDILGHEIKYIQESLYEAKDAAQRVSIVNNYLLHRFQLLTPKINGADHAQQLLLQTFGQQNIHELVNDLGVSMSTLERNFKKQIGLSPKHYARIIRFNRIFRIIRQKGFSDWHDIIYECGYFDQAHFIKDFTRFTGETPRSYFSRQKRLDNFYSGK